MLKYTTINLEVSNKLCVFSCILTISMIWFNIECLIIFSNISINTAVTNHIYEDTTENNNAISQRLYWLNVSYFIVLFAFAAVLNCTYWLFIENFAIKSRSLLLFIYFNILFLIRISIVLAIFYTASIHSFAIDDMNMNTCFLIISNITSFLLITSTCLYFIYNRNMFANKYSNGKFSTCDDKYYEMCGFGDTAVDNEKLAETQKNIYSNLNIKDLEDLIDWTNVNSYKL